MAEAIAIVGLVSSIVTCIDTARRAYEAVQDADDLPRAFKVISDRMPLVISIFQRIKRKYEASGDDKDVRKVVEGCETNAQALSRIFEKVCPSEGAGRRERYSKALQSLKPGRSEKVEVLWKDILESLSTLQAFHIFKQLVPLAELRAAMEEIADVEESLSEDAGVVIYSSGQGSNFATGSSQQKNLQNFGAGYTAENMTFVSSSSHTRPVRSPSSEAPYHDTVPFSELSEAYTDRADSTPMLEAAMRVPSKRQGLKHFVAVTGMAATGKTQTVLKYAQDRLRKYDTILWIDAETSQSLLDSFDRIAHDLGLLDAQSSTGTTPSKSPGVQKTMAWLHSRPLSSNWLAIYDNVDDLSWGIIRMMPSGAAGSLIITTQDSKLPGLVSASTAPIDVMSDDDALRLCFRSIPSALKYEGSVRLRNTCQEVVYQLGHLPLAIYLAGATISGDPQLLSVRAVDERSVHGAVNRYLQNLSKHRDRVLGESEHEHYTLRHKHTVATAWDAALYRLEQSDRKEGNHTSTRRLLTLMAFLNPKVILYQQFAQAYCTEAFVSCMAGTGLPQWLSFYLIGNDPAPEEILRPPVDEAWDAFNYERAVTSLWRYGLIRSADGDWKKETSIHSLVRWRAQQDGTKMEYLTAYTGLLELAIGARTGSNRHRDPSVYHVLSDLTTIYEELDKLDAAASTLRTLLTSQTIHLGRADTSILYTVSRLVSIRLRQQQEELAGKELFDFVNQAASAERSHLIQGLGSTANTVLQRYISTLQARGRSKTTSMPGGNSYTARIPDPTQVPRNPDLGKHELDQGTQRSLLVPGRRSKGPPIFNVLAKNIDPPMFDVSAATCDVGASRQMESAEASGQPSTYPTGSMTRQESPDSRYKGFELTPYVSKDGSNWSRSTRHEITASEDELASIYRQFRRETSSSAIEVMDNLPEDKKSLSIAWSPE